MMDTLRRERLVDEFVEAYVECHDYSSSRFDRANSWPVCSQICDEPSPDAKSHACNWTASKSSPRHEQSAATVSGFTSHQSTHSADARPRRRVHRHASAAIRVSTHAWPGTCSSPISRLSSPRDLIVGFRESVRGVRKLHSRPATDQELRLLPRSPSAVGAAGPGVEAVKGQNARPLGGRDPGCGHLTG